jgi:hypothetical protein
MGTKKANGRVDQHVEVSSDESESSEDESMVVLDCIEVK